MKLNPLHLYGRSHVDHLIGALQSEYLDSYFLLNPLNFATDRRNAKKFLSVLFNAIETIQDAGFKRIIMHFTFATKLGAHFIHEDGSMEPKEGPAGEREYFDGTVIRIRHANSGCIDLDEKTIFVQEPWGRVFDKKAGKALKHAFNGFSFVDLQLAQQKDYHSCMTITLNNMEVFAQGRIPTETCDAMEIRARHNKALDNASFPKGVVVLTESSFARPVYLQRYLS